MTNPLECVGAAVVVSGAEKDVRDAASQALQKFNNIWIGFLEKTGKNLVAVIFIRTQNGNPNEIMPNEVSCFVQEIKPDLTVLPLNSY